jgi:hypothetical protein
VTYSLDHCTEAQLSVIELIEVKQAGRCSRITKLRLKDSARALELLAKAAGLAGEWPAGARGLWPDATARTPSNAAPHNVNIQVIYEQRDRRPLVAAELVSNDPDNPPGVSRLALVGLKSESEQPQQCVIGGNHARCGEN